jgi:hypothetical protein
VLLAQEERGGVLRLEQHGEVVTVVVQSSASRGMARTGSDVRRRGCPMVLAVRPANACGCGAWHRPGPTHVEHRSLSAALGPMDTGLSRRAHIQWRSRRGAAGVTSPAASMFQHETFWFSPV